MFTYRFKLDDVVLLEIPVFLDGQPPGGDREPVTEHPEWVKLSYKQCPNCPLDANEVENCPAAENLERIVASFSDVVSYEELEVEVEGHERFYSKHCPAQVGLKSLFGLVMACSPCPILGQFKAMAKYHLPFSNMNETMFRSLAFYLIAQLIVHRQGEAAPDWDLENLTGFYVEVSKVNRSFSERLAAAAQADANLNAMVKLNTVSAIASFGMDDFLGEMADLFTATQLKE